jgi:hypothetical protein
MTDKTQESSDEQIGVQPLVLWFLRRFRYVRELERVERQHIEYVAGETTIEDITIDNGAITLYASTRMVHVMAAQMAAVLDGHDAENYVEMQMQHEDGRRFAVTVQRCEGKTPHEKRLEAESKLAELLAAS